MEIVINVFGCSNVFGAEHFGFPESFGGPGRFRKVRETDRLNFLQISSKCDMMMPSYDQKTKIASTKK